MPLNVCRTRNIVAFQGALRWLDDRPETWVVQVEKVAPFLEVVQFLASFGSPNTLCFAGRLKSFSDQWMELIMTSSFCDTIYFQVQPVFPVMIIFILFIPSTMQKHCVSQSWKSLCWVVVGLTYKWEACIFSRCSQPQKRREGLIPVSRWDRRSATCWGPWEEGGTMCRWRYPKDFIEVASWTKLWRKLWM